MNHKCNQQVSEKMKTIRSEFNLLFVSTLVFVSILLMTVSVSQAQDRKTDSLFLKLEQSLNKEDSIKTLIEICYSSGFGLKTDKDKYLNQLELLAKNSKNLVLKAQAFNALGKGFEETNLVKANENYSLALDLYKNMGGKTGEWGYATTLLKYGTVFHYNGDFGSAIKMYLDAENTLNKYNDLKQLAALYIKLGDAYDKLAKPDKRNFYNQKAINIALKCNDKKLLGKAYMTKAINLIYDENYKEAESFCEKANQIALELGDKMQQHIFNYNMGLLYSRKELYNQSLDYYKKAYYLAKEIRAHNDECDALYKIGLIQYYVEQHSIARKTLIDAVTLADSLNSNILKRNIYDVLSCLEADIGNHKKSNEYLNKYIDLIYLIFSDESQKQVNFLEAKYQSQKREGEIIRLKDEKKIKDLQLAKNKQWIFILLSIVLLLSVTAIALYINYRHKKIIAQQESLLKEQKILELEKDRQLLATQSVLKGEEAERSRLARDLHDGLGGLLLSIKLSLSNTKENMAFTEDGVDQYNKALGLLDTSMKELRRVAHNMMPEALVKFGLKDALADFCSSLSSNDSCTTITFQFFGEEKRIDSKFEIGLYRIAQELINNTLKYSKATDLMVQLIQEPDRVHLTVQDNGKGFDMQILKTSKGSGIANIQSRVESLNGYFDIYSEPDKGTEASVEFKYLSLPQNQIVS